MVRSTWPAFGSAVLTLMAGLACSSAQDPGASQEPRKPLECTPITAPANWADWVMPNPAVSGLPNPASYELSASGNRVTDQVTRLVWQRNVDPHMFTWEAAKQYCSCLVVDGSDGWRLPSRIELVSLVDWSLTSPSIDAQAFPDTTNENFWAASPVTINPGLAYLSFFLRLAPTVHQRVTNAGRRPRQSFDRQTDVPRDAERILLVFVARHRRRDARLDDVLHQRQHLQLRQNCRQERALRALKKRRC